MTLITMGIAIAAVAVLLVTSDINRVKVRIMSTVTYPPLIPMLATMSPKFWCRAAVIDQGTGSQTTCKDKDQIPDDLLLEIDIRIVSLLVIRNEIMAQMINTYAGVSPGSML